MRKNTLFSLALFIATLMILNTPAFAQTEADFTIGSNADGTVTITRYEGWDTELVIPGTIGGKPVTAIGSEAFRKTDLTSVVIPDSVKTIGQSAFADNNLASAVLGEGVIDIGLHAFANNKLTSIVIPDSVQTIRSNDEPDFFNGDNTGAFDGNQLTDITIGSGLISIGGFAFWSDFSHSKIERITLAANAVFDVSIFGNKIFYDYMCNDRKAGTYIADENWGRTYQDIESKSIFKESDNFRYIETEYGLAICGYRGDLNRLAIPEQIDGKPVKFIVGTKSGITGVRIPATVTAIGKGAFSECQLTTVAIPDSVTFIGESAFNSVVDNAFDPVMDSRVTNQLTSVTLGKGLTWIGDHAFAGGEDRRGNQLTSVVIPDGVTYIGSSAFSGNQLTSVAIPDSVTSIGRHAFYRNPLTSLTLGNGLASIGEYAFYGNQLASIVIPDSVTYIGNRAFYYGDQLTSLTLGNGLASIGEYAFYSHRLTSVAIPDSVTSIGRNAFSGHSQLTSVTLGANVVFNPGFISSSLGTFYTSNGEKAGVYTYDRNRWSYQAE